MAESEFQAKGHASLRQQADRLSLFASIFLSSPQAEQGIVEPRGRAGSKVIKFTLEMPHRNTPNTLCITHTAAGARPPPKSDLEPGLWDQQP